MAASDDQTLLNLRQRFAQECTKLETLPDQRDIQRVESDDTYVRSFLRHMQGDEDEAFQMLVDCLAWRKTFGVQDLCATDLDEHLVRSGVCFPHGQDQDGNACLLLSIRLHKKDAEKLPKMKSLFVFMLEQLWIREPGRQVSVIFDMTDTGLGNMDMELIRFVIDCFKYYFPNMLNVLLVHEMPFILQTVWRIVKGWLSERAQAKIKFVKGSDIQQYIAPDQLLKELGGRDKYRFDADEFYQTYSRPDLGQFESVLPEDGDEASASSVDTEANASPTLKRVHFAEEFSSSADSSAPDKRQKSTVARQDSTDSASSLTQQQRQAHVQSMLQHQTSKESSSATSLRRRHVSTAGLMEISPSSVIEFRSSGSDDVAIPLTLQNISTNTIGFKVKTTGPDRYHVKPSSGIIATGASSVTNVTLRSGSDASAVANDKFLVEYCPVPPTLQATELQRFLKTVDRSAMQEKILRTQMTKPSSVTVPPPAKTTTADTKPSTITQVTGGPVVSSAGQLDKSIANLATTVDSLERSQRQLQRKVERVTDLAYVLIVFLVVLLLVAILHTGGLARFDSWMA